MAKQKFEYRDFDTLSYPDDLDRHLVEGDEDGFTYPDCIRFGVRKRIGMSIENVVTAGGKAQEKMAQGWRAAEKAAGLDDQWVKKQQNKIASENLSPEAAAEKLNASYKARYKEIKGEDPPENVLQLFGTGINTFLTSMEGVQKNVRDLKAQGQTANELGAIYLNMPNAIQFNEEADWSGQEIGAMGNMVKSAVEGDSQAVSTLKGVAAGNVGNIVGSAVGGIGALMSKMGVQGGLFGMALGAMAAGSPIQKGLEKSLAVAQNPYMEMMFSGIGFRQFQFDFKFLPKSTKEQAIVHSIIKMFRLNSRPTYVQGEFGKSFMNYPMEFNIEFLTKSKAGRLEDTWNTNSSLPQLKPVVCGNVTTNYTPDNQWSAHEGGRPNAIQLSLSFKETELVMAEDLVADEGSGFASDYEPYGGF
jgi:hypothetical protein